MDCIYIYRYTVTPLESKLATSLEHELESIESIDPMES